MPVGNGCVQNAREHFTGFRVDWSRKEPLVCITLEDWQEAPEILFQRGFHIVCPVSAWRQPRWLCKALAQCCSFLWGCFLVTTHERRLLNLPCAHWPHFQRPYSTLKTQRTLRSQQGQCCPVFLSVALSGERTWDAVGANIWGGGLTTPNPQLRVLPESRSLSCTLLHAHFRLPDDFLMCLSLAPKTGRGVLCPQWHNCATSLSSFCSLSQESCLFS